MNAELDEHLDDEREDRRPAVRMRGHFLSDEAAMKLLYLMLNHAAKQWKRPPREWVEARTQFAVAFGERFVSQ